MISTQRIFVKECTLIESLHRTKAKLTASSITPSEVSSLQHEVSDDTVEFAALVAEEVREAGRR